MIESYELELLVQNVSKLLNLLLYFLFFFLFVLKYNNRDVKVSFQETFQIIDTRRVDERVVLVRTALDVFVSYAEETNLLSVFFFVQIRSNAARKEKIEQICCSTFLLSFCFVELPVTILDYIVIPPLEIVNN